MAYIIWNGAGYFRGISRNESDKNYFLSHDQNLTTTDISDDEALAVLRKEKMIMAADWSGDNTDETPVQTTKDNYNIIDIEGGARLPNEAMFKHTLEEIIKLCDLYILGHNQDGDATFKAKVVAHRDNCNIVLEEINGGSWTAPSWPAHSVYKYIEERFGNAISDWEIP